MIGYGNQTVKNSEKPAVIEANEEELIFSADMILRMKAFEKINHAIDEYMNKAYRPFVQGKDRDKWFQETITKIRERYLDPI